ncbi:hypothetical protein [Cupriavidus sp. SW-Y-13]|uniref:hypothetical protein n=1 Tax=Cupriavidus sp. SW-Y-13 TaxID=2653854 RepID=UPI00139D7264|nr:hypothetical protein [Cupriavidus sp. SW-Y-13]MWL87136.1 hypothetical protein [Cupriavidus sp. SW-Y-13]
MKKHDVIVEGDVGQVVVASSVVYHAGSGPGQMNNAINMGGSIEHAHSGVATSACNASISCGRCAALAKQLRRFKLALALMGAAMCGAIGATARSHVAEAAPPPAVATQCQFDGRQYSAGSIVKMMDGLSRECLDAGSGRSLKWSEYPLRPI